MHGYIIKRNKIEKYKFNCNECAGLDYMPSSPELDKISKIIPLLSQEDHLHFFKHRFEEIIKKLFDYYENVIVDCPPGLFGISKTIFQLSKTYNDSEKIKSMPFLITTLDSVDYLSLIPFFFRLLENSLKKKSNTKKPEELLEELQYKILLNKYQGRDSTTDFGKIIDSLNEKYKNDSTNSFRERGGNKDIMEYFAEKATDNKISVPNVEDFNMCKIVSDCKNYINGTIDNQRKHDFFENLKKELQWQQSK